MRYESSTRNSKSFPQGEAQPRACDVPGCEQAGEHRAPKSPDQLNDYYWFCLGHVRDFNKQWDYFDGMDASQIEDFIKDAVTGHRPTWRREDHFSFTSAGLYEALDRFFGRAQKRRAAPEEIRMSPKERKALALLDLSGPFSAQELKTRYKQLVKQCHPDLNPGSPLAEERFKKITVAYALLKKWMEK